MAVTGRLNLVLLECPLPLSDKQAAIHNEQARSEIAGYGVITVRTLRPNEAMPQHLNTGFEQMPVMNDFVWIAEKQEKIIGMLVASPCHGLVFFVHVRTEKGTSTMTIPLLFRKCVKDCMERGFKGYFGFLDPRVKADREFILVCRKAGGTQIVSEHFGIVGKLEEAGRY
jgi:hypothetical protein